MAHQQRPLYGIGLIKVDFAAEFRGDVAGVLIIGILAENSDFSLRQGVYYFIYDGGLTASGATCNTYDEHWGAWLKFIFAKLVIFFRM